MAQYQIPGGAYFVESTAGQYQIPGGAYWNSSATPAPPVVNGGRYYERYLPRTNQPQDAVGIDTSSRFARSLKSLIVGGVNNDLITGLPLTVANPTGVALTPTAYGNSWHNTTGAVSTLVPTIGNAPCLFIYRGYVPNPNSQEAGTNYLFGSSDNGVGLHIGVGGFLTNWYMFGIAAVNANEVFPGGWVTIVIHRKSDGTTRLFRDGVFKNAGTSDVKTLNEARFAVGSLSHNSPTASGFNVEAQTVLFGVSANEDFSDAEIAEISQNTNAIFEPEVERIWIADSLVSLPTLVQPNGTISAGSWTPTGAATLHDAINELVPSVTEYISTDAASTVELTLAEAAFPGGANQTLAYRASSTVNSNLTITLKQGSTVIMTRTHALSIDDTLYTQTLTEVEISLITAGAINVSLTTT